MIVAMNGVDIMSYGNLSLEVIKIALPMGCLTTGGKHLKVILKNMSAC